MRRSTLVGLGLILIFSAVLDCFVSMRASPTEDEFLHYQYGVHVLQFHPDHRYNGFYDSQMPVSALNAAFDEIADHLSRHPSVPSKDGGPRHYRSARVPTILAALLLTVVVFFWSRDLYGDSAALAASVLCMLSPNLMAHGTLVTTDMYQALGFMAALYFLRRFLLDPTTGRAIISGLVLALAQLTKTFTVALYLIAIVFLAIAALRPPLRGSFTPKRLLVFATAVVASFVFVLNVAYCFDRSFMSLGSYKFETKVFSSLQQTSFARHMPVPVPYPYLQGMDMTKFSEQTGRSYGDIYLLGEVRNPLAAGFRPFKSYYVVAWFFKEPIGLQILFFGGLFWIARRRKLDEFLFGEGLLLSAAMFLVVWLSLFSAAQIGIRHVLPALAAEVVIASASFTNFQAKAWPAKALLCLLVAWIAVSVARYYPQMIPYMNEWVRDPRYAWKIIADSNLDWGQDFAIVNSFVKDNPDVQVDPITPAPGRVLVRANRLTGVNRWDKSCVFLSKNYQPVAQVGYGHFLFLIPPKTSATDMVSHR